MRKISHCCFVVLFAWLALFLIAPSLIASDSLVWHREQDRVDADIETWDVRNLLEHVAAATGWHIYLDPGAIHKVSVKFNDLPSGEALHSMLSGLNFVMVPKTNAPSELYVFRTSRHQATRVIMAAVPKSARPISNELIVTCKGSKTKIDDLARALERKSFGRMRMRPQDFYLPSICR